MTTSPRPSASDTGTTEQLSAVVQPGSDDDIPTQVFGTDGEHHVTQPLPTGFYGASEEPRARAASGGAAAGAAPAGPQRISASATTSPWRAPATPAGAPATPYAPSPAIPYASAPYPPSPVTLAERMPAPASAPMAPAAVDEPHKAGRKKRIAHFQLIRSTLFTVVCALGLWQSFEFLIGTPAGQKLDQVAELGGGMGRTLSGETADSVLNVVSVTMVAAAMVVVVIIAFARRRVWVALSAAAVIAGANVTTQLLKKSLLERPALGVTPSDLNTFPSGHTTVAASIAVALIMVVGPRLRPLVTTLGIGYTIATAVATVVMGWHRPSDAIGGILVTGLWAGIVMMAGAIVRGRASGSTGTIKGATFVLMVVGAGSTALGALLGYRMIGSMPSGMIATIDAMSHTDAAITFAAGALVICGLAAFVDGAVMGLVSGTKKRS